MLSKSKQILIQNLPIVIKMEAYLRKLLLVHLYNQNCTLHSIQLLMDVSNTNFIWNYLKI